MAAEVFANSDLSASVITRSLVRGCDFSHSFGSPVTFTWNDFLDCRFVGADLRFADLRGSLFERCVFEDANMEGCDLRLTVFRACRLDGAKLAGAMVTVGQWLLLPFDKQQRRAIKVKLTRGRLPAGG